MKFPSYLNCDGKIVSEMVPRMNNYITVKPLIQTCQPLRILRSHYAFRVSNTALRKPVQNVGKLRILRNFGAIRPIPRNLQQLSRLAVSRKSPAGQNIDKGLVYFTITISFGVRFRHPINKQVKAEAELRGWQGFQGWARIRSHAETTDRSRKLASAIVCQ